MTSEKRQTGADYLANFKNLSDALDEHVGPDNNADLDQLLDNAAAGRAPTVNEDGASVALAEQITQLWQTHQEQIQQVENQYQDVKNFPQHLSEWLDHKHIERSTELDAMVEKHRYSGLNGLREQSHALYVISNVSLRC